MDRPQLIAQPRAPHGTRAACRTRREGLVPAIVYGKTTKPIPILVNRGDLYKMIHARAGEHGLLTLCIEGQAAETSKASRARTSSGRWEKPVLIKRIEHDPVHGEITHIDFHAIVLTEQVRVKVPIILTGQPVGVKQDGGVLEHFLRELDVECLPTDIPKHVEYEISALKIGDAVHVRDLMPPTGSRILTDPESVIASVLAPKVEKIEEAAAAVTEPEVIREKKPEAEEEGTGKEAAEKAEKKEDKKEEKEKK